MGLDIGTRHPQQEVFNITIDNYDAEKIRTFGWTAPGCPV